MSRPEIKTAEQLKGGSVAVSTFGGQCRFFRSHCPKEARTDSGEGCRNRADRHGPRIG